MFGLANPWVILGLVIAFAAVGIKGYFMGQESTRAEWLAATMKEQQLAEQIRGEIRNEGDKISAGLEERIGKIRVVHRTVNQVVKKEIEVHHVLKDPRCRYPESTVRVLNDARSGKDAPRPAAGQPAGPVPAASPAK